MSQKGPFCGNNKPQDLANMTDFEKKHLPVIECPDTVTIQQYKVCPSHSHKKIVPLSLS